MWRFIVRRFFYSLLVICGVLFLTFALFNLAAGDPAAAALGKNAKPAEIESLRRELGADLPLFWGHLRRTEAFRSGDKPGDYVRNFPADDVLAVVTSPDGARREVKIAAGAEFFRVSPGCQIGRAHV